MVGFRAIVNKMEGKMGPYMSNLFLKLLWPAAFSFLFSRRSAITAYALNKTHFSGSNRKLVDKKITSQESEFVQSQSDTSIINLHLGQPSPHLLPMQEIAQASTQRFTGENSMILQYGSGQGYLSFRKDLSKMLSGMYGTKINPEELFISGGNSHAISLACQVCLKKTGRKVVFVEDPSYFLAFNIFREQGAEIVPIEMDSDGVIVGQIERLLESGTIPAMLYTIPVFHNPTGCSLSKPRLDRLMLLSQKYGFYIVADEPYQFLNYENAQTQVLSKMTSAPNGSRIISLGTFSKIFAPGLRLGWIHTSPSIVNDLLSTAVIQSGGCINPLVAGLVHSAILQGTLQNHLERLVGTYQARKRAICKALREKCPDIEFDEPDGGYFVWVKIPSDVDAARLLEVARGRHGVAFTPGPRCSAAAAGGEGERFADRARLSFAFYDARELEEGIDRLAKALAEVRHSSHKNDDK